MRGLEVADRGSVPNRVELMGPTLSAIRSLGGSASNKEIVNQVIEDLGISTRIAEIPKEGDSRTRLEYNLAWARSNLREEGLIYNSEHGVWSLTTSGKNAGVNNPNSSSGASIEHSTVEPSYEEGEHSSIGDVSDEYELGEWREDLISELLNLSPDSFERLCMRVLRESGFIEVEVTGSPNDGGIDGSGIIRIAGLISFPVLFQCKRYSGSVGATVIRDFRGAMVGRADRGLILTTGRFTREAHREATRDGAPPIDLIDGELLIERLKELGLGVKTKMVEVVEIDKGWFETI